MAGTAKRVLASVFTEAANVTFEEAFRHQYVLSKTPLDLSAFRQLKVGPFYLYHSADLPVARLTTKSGRQLGWVLGFAVDARGMLVDNEVRLDAKPASGNAIEHIETFVSGLSGRYVVIASFADDGKTVSRLFLDPIGALGAIYDPANGVVASSLLLALTRDLEPNPIFEVPAEIRAIPEFSKILPQDSVGTGLKTTCFGQTFDKHARQLLSNHALDLVTFTAERRPNVSVDEALSDPDVAATAIVDRLHTILSALQAKYSGYMAISGGQDSRMLVASAPDGFSDFFRYYSYSDNWITELDLSIAQSLSERVGADFLAQPRSATANGSFFPNRKRSRNFQVRCAISTGLKTMGDTWWRNGYFRKLDFGKMWIRGNALEVVTARLWTPTVNAPYRKAMRHALRRLRLNTEDSRLSKVLMEELTAWRESLPDEAQPVFPDFWYQELFLSHGQGDFLGLNDLIYFPPASDGGIFAAARAVPPDLRRVNALYDAVIRAGRSDLAEFPLTRDLVARRKAEKASQKAAAHKTET
ncbi:hypothetical protein [Marivita sp. XM-24bin2]|jgi:hypothetical protein|uniref:hypothetical protein n=1 Tax=unclassified Marivita TaxID=2632480 RepID=UPI000D7B798D|nr:hypothetical protein [Marivita sp. XM-24bin2]MCR9110084.1 hypothetical protein [Paracoccaceae bacterium]PWL34295.1 MAG: hypothetical protein DCO97_15300 [Marivita sp. XM-24bin2]